MSPTDSRRRIARIVTKVSGLSGLRPGHQAVIDAGRAGPHTLAIMPIRAGQSWRYQVPAMLMPGTTARRFAPGRSRGAPAGQQGKER